MTAIVSRLDSGLPATLKGNARPRMAVKFSSSNELTLTPAQRQRLLSSLLQRGFFRSRELSDTLVTKSGDGSLLKVINILGWQVDFGDQK